MTKDNDPIRPHVVDTGSQVFHDPGLTKREYFAFEFAKMFINLDWTNATENGVEYADLLIEKLNEPKESK